MEHPVAALQVALRVLTAISEYRNPDPGDIELLKAYAPSLADSPADELACEVVQLTLKRRAEPRTEVAGS